MQKQLSNSPDKKQVPWLQIIDTPQKISEKQQKNMKRQQLNRKKAYREALDKQVQQNDKNRMEWKLKGNEQRRQMQKQCQNQQHTLANNKYLRMKNQQKYRLDNLQLAKSYRKNFNSIIENKNNFIPSIFNQQDLRKNYSKSNFEEQNAINNIQVITHKNQYQSQRQQVKTPHQLNQYPKFNLQKGNKKNKLFILKQCQIDNKTTLTPPPKYSYQIQSNNYPTNHLNHIIKDSVYDINKHVQIVNSSPAYLGQSSLQRRKQLDILDKAMFGTKIMKKIRADSEMNAPQQPSNPTSINPSPQLQKNKSQQTIKIITQKPTFKLNQLSHHIKNNTSTINYTLPNPQINDSILSNRKLTKINCIL